MADQTEPNFGLNEDDSNEPTDSVQRDAELNDAGAADDSSVDTAASDDTVPTAVGEERLEDSETEEERAARESEQELLWLFQSTVFDPNGQKIGRVGQVYLDDQTQAPNWVTVKTGLFGMKEFFIPLDDGERDDRRITVPYDKATVLASPRTEVDQNLSPSEEDALYNHYQVEGKMTEVITFDDGVDVATGGNAADASPVAEPDVAESDVPEPAFPDSAFPEPAQDERSDAQPASGSDFDAVFGENAAGFNNDSEQQVDPEAFANPDEKLSDQQDSDENLGDHR
ncbi:MAG: PRC-barrel domain-containing protein [Leucobacter sp.]